MVSHSATCQPTQMDTQSLAMLNIAKIGEHYNMLD